MKVWRLLHSLPVSLLILRSASVFVPGEGRDEWLAEWKSELWQVCHARHHGPDGWFHDSEEATAFCLGAFQDAFWLRRNNPRAVAGPTPRSVFSMGSATRCGLSLAIWAAASVLICLCFPSTRRVLTPSPYRDPGNLVIISTGGSSGTQKPAIRPSDYRSWKTNTHRLFAELAFYEPIVSRVHLARHETATLSIARSSDNLFQLLNVPFLATFPAPTDRPHLARLILSRTTWRKLFRSEPNLGGRVVELAGQPVLIEGVLSDDSWQLPGHVDAWLLEDEHALNVLPSNSKGFVLARAIASGFSTESGKERTMTVVRSPGEIDLYNCISIAHLERQPFSIFLFTLLLACLALPATTPLSLGDYPPRNDRLPRSTRVRRWIFLTIKFALILTIVYFTSVSLAYIAYPVASPASIYIQLGSSFFGFLFAFRWALRDQRSRCPVCLRVLSNPARVGQASCNFLAWNGTELICTEGHGLLHIPEIPTSWFSTQRWLYLDPSWRCLFSEASVPFTELA